MSVMFDARSLLVAAMRRHGLGGAAVAIVREGERPTFECVGLADRNTNRSVDPDTVFRIASISKTMTAIGLMQLRDRGLVELDEPVNTYLKRFTVEPPPGGPEVTCRHLLTHTAGIGEVPRWSDLIRREVWGVGRPGTSPADLGTSYRGTLRPETAAGVKWERLMFWGDEDVEFIEATYEPGGASSPDDAFVRHNGHEFGYVLSGTLRVVVGFDEFVLEHGRRIRGLQRPPCAGTGPCAATGWVPAAVEGAGYGTSGHHRVGARWLYRGPLRGAGAAEPRCIRGVGHLWRRAHEHH